MHHLPIPSVASLSEFCLMRALTLTLNQRVCVLSAPRPSSYPQLGSSRNLLSVYLDLFD